MNNQAFSKIISMNGVLSVDDLSPSEKRDLMAIMVKHGATGGFSYDRFFQKGFKQWELRGITSIKSDFLKVYGKELLGEDKDGDKGYAFALSLDKGKGTFYKAIGSVRGLISKLKDFMRELGMNSDTTIIRRFSEDDWKEYELLGIVAIINEFIDYEQSKGAKEAVDVEQAAVAMGG